jgi:uncharacterized protein (TIGR03067 family)
MKSTCILLIAALVAFSPAEDAVKDAKAKLKGSWTSTEVLKKGEGTTMTVGLKFDGDRLTITVNGSDVIEGTYSIDPSKSPAAIDVTFEKDGNSVTVAAAYEFKGDSLRICHVIDGGPRPTAIESNEKTALVTLKRDK